MGKIKDITGQKFGRLTAIQYLGQSKWRCKCDEWLNNFMNFYNWAMDDNYRDGLTIDRIDVNGNYHAVSERIHRLNWSIEQALELEERHHE